MEIPASKQSAKSIACVALLMALPASAQAATVLDATRVAVDQIRGRTQNETSHPTGYLANFSNTTVGTTGSAGSRNDNNVIYRYALPTLPVGQSVGSFSFSFQITGLRDHSGGKYELDVYLLDLEDPTGTGTSLFFHGASDPDHALVGSHFIDTGSNNNTFNLSPPVEVTFTVSSGPSFELLQSFYAGGHVPTQDWASFRFNLDQLYVNSESDPLGSVGLNRYVINDDVGTSALTITAIPEPATALLGGLGLLALLRRRRA